MVSWLLLCDWQSFSVLVVAVLQERFDRYSFPPLRFRRHQQDSSRPHLCLAGDGSVEGRIRVGKIGHLKPRAAQVPRECVEG